MQTFWAIHLGRDVSLALLATKIHHLLLAGAIGSIAAQEGGPEEAAGATGASSSEFWGEAWKLRPSSVDSALQKSRPYIPHWQNEGFSKLFFCCKGSGIKRAKSENQTGLSVFLYQGHRATGTGSFGCMMIDRPGGGPSTFEPPETAASCWYPPTRKVDL